MNITSDKTWWFILSLLEVFGSLVNGATGIVKAIIKSRNISWKN